jgi:hypothetical protein
MAKQARVLDGRCQAVIEKHPNAVVAWWLMASFLYYHRDVSLLSDDMFDKLGVRLAGNWNGISHPHKHLIKPDMTKSGFYIREDDYPLMCKGAALRLVGLEE